MVKGCGQCRQEAGLTGCLVLPQRSAQTEKTTAREQQG